MVLHVENGEIVKLRGISRTNNLSGYLPTTKATKLGKSAATLSADDDWKEGDGIPILDKAIDQAIADGGFSMKDDDRQIAIEVKQLRHQGGVFRG